jgi:hypothetical protein
VESTDPEGSAPGASTPDDWTPWSTPEADAGAAEPDATADVESSAPVASARAKRLASGGDPAPTRASRRRGDGAAGAAAAPVAQHRAAFSVGGIIAAVGGIVVVVGSLLEMVKVGLGPNQLTVTTLSTTYFDTDNGKIVAALGAVVLVLALATLVRPISSIIPSIVVAACGLAAAGLALSDRFDLGDAGADYRRAYFSNNQLRGLVQVTIGPALYVAIAGGVIATIGAVLASRDR